MVVRSDHTLVCRNTSGAFKIRLQQKTLAYNTILQHNFTTTTTTQFYNNKRH